MLNKTLIDFYNLHRLQCKSNLRYLLRITKEGSDFDKDCRTYKITDGNYDITYNCIFKLSDSFSVDTFNKAWSTDMNWEQLYHPDYLYQWFDKSQVVLTNRGLELNASQKPKVFNNITIPNAIGLIKSKATYKYGIFIITAKQPLGKGIWNAIWTTGSVNWPPEIDLLEGYSEDTIDFNNKKTFKSNVHVKSGVFGSNTHKLFPATSSFIEYVLWWTKDFIRIYYNGYKVIDISNKKILDSVNEPMNIIIGMGIEPEYFKGTYAPFIIKQVTVIQP